MDELEDLTAEERLQSAKNIVEEMDTISFISTELGLGEEERDMWRGRLEYDLRQVLQTKRFCSGCGFNYEQGEEHICNFF